MLDVRRDAQLLELRRRDAGRAVVGDADRGDAEALQQRGDVGLAGLEQPRVVRDAEDALLATAYACGGSTARLVRANAWCPSASTLTSVKTMPWFGEVSVNVPSQTAPAASGTVCVRSASTAPSKSRAHQVTTTPLSVVPPLTTCARRVIVCPASSTG